MQERPAAGVRAARAQALLAWALPALVMGAVLLWCGIRYDTNDDATIANIAAGAYGPDRVHLVYVNILFGWLLRPLYTLAGGLNWYVLALLALLLAAAAALCRLALRRLGVWRGGAVFLAAALPCAAAWVWRIQYVKVSGLCLAAGLAWLAVYLGAPLRRCWPGILLALAGSLLRWDMFLAVGGLSAAVLLARFAALDTLAKRRALAALGLLFALVLGAKGADVLAYQMDAGWRDFTAYNAARMAFSDHKVYFLGEENPFAGQGVSDNDYAMLRSWDFYDGTVFPAQRVAALAAQVPGKDPAAALRDTLHTALDLSHGTPYRLFFSLALLAALLLLRWDRHSLAFWGSGALLGAELFYLTLRQRTPEYVTAPLLLAAGVFLALGAVQGHWRPVGAAAARAARWLPALALAAGLLLGGPALWRTRADAAAYREWAALEQDYFDAMSADKEHLYLLPTAAINVGEGLDVWHPRAPGYYSNIVYYGGWLSHAPHREAALAAYGLRDPLVDAVDDPNVYVGYQNIEASARYAAEHLGRPVQAVEEGPNAFAPYRLYSQGP